MNFLKRRLVYLAFCFVLLGWLEFTKAETSYWGQAQFGGSVLDTKTDSPVLRGSLGFQTGIRRQSFGLFLNAEANRSVEFSSNRNDIDFLQVGPGLDFILPRRQLRTSISFGPTVLTRASHLKTGWRGWFVDIRPVSIRFPLKSGGILELTPLAIDITHPSDDSSDAMYSNFTGISYEWSVK